MALLDLLPAFTREADRESGRALEALLGVIGEQADLLRDDVEALWDDFFVETCADWVVPYIGDLLGNVPIHDVAGTRRADVARTLSYRRRKGTLPMLEEVARSVTGWRVRAAEGFERVAWTQHLDHLRADPPAGAAADPWSGARVGSADLRDRDALDRLDGPFDTVAHTVDVREPGAASGWHNVRSVLFFAWRLRSYPMEAQPARRSPDHPHVWHASPLGAPLRLFTDPDPEESETGLAGEIHVPAPIRRLALHRDLLAHRGAPAEATTAYYGPGRSLHVVRDGIPVPARDVRCMDLSTWAEPPGGKVGVDPVLGRVAFPATGQPDAVLLRYAYGFSSELGGGPYDRRRRRVEADDADDPDVVADPAAWGRVVRVTDRASLLAALAAWDGEANPRLVVEIATSDPIEGNLAIEMKGEGLVIQAANRARPAILGSVAVSAGAGDPGALTLGGLLVAGSVTVAGGVSDLRLAHATLVPGLLLDEAGLPRRPRAASLVVEDDATSVEIDRSITGRLRVDKDAPRVALRDSIVDAFGGVALDAPGGGFAPEAVVARSTVLGSLHVRALALADAAILAGGVQAERVQRGCARFSWIPLDSRAPRRYRCQPDLALAAEGRSESDEQTVLRLLPQLASTRYGDAAYCQLSRTTAREIKEGAEDGSEMGAFAHVRAPHREANLRLRLDEYLPWGLKAGIIHVT